MSRALHVLMTRLEISPRLAIKILSKGLLTIVVLDSSRCALTRNWRRRSDSDDIMMMGGGAGLAIICWSALCKSKFRWEFSFCSLIVRASWSLSTGICRTANLFGARNTVADRLLLVFPWSSHPGFSLIWSVLFCWPARRERETDWRIQYSTTKGRERVMRTWRRCSERRQHPCASATTY